MFKIAIEQYLKRTGFEAFRPKAVLFDMDGVLIDSMPNHVVAWRESMAQFGIDMTSYDAYATEGARGVDTIRKMVKTQQGRDIDEEEAQRMYDVKAYLFAQMPKAKVMPGAYALMEKLHRDGLKVAVVTGSGQRPLINRLTKEFKPFVTRKSITTAYDVKNGKPAPDPYLMGMQKCGTKPWETIVVENAPLGVQAGHAAQCLTIGVNTGPLPKNVLKDAGADILMKSMPRLCDRWDRLYREIRGISTQSHATLKQEDNWEAAYKQIMAYMTANKRRPSKHHEEDRPMHYWIKYNKRTMARGKMSEERQKKFRRLLEMAAKYRRLNQNAYMAPEQALSLNFDNE